MTTVTKKTFHRLSVPSFDLKWCSLFEDSNLLLLCGGGGGTKSGVKNQLQIVRIIDPSKIEVVTSYITDDETTRRLCCGVATGKIGKHAVVVALLDSDCLVLSVERDDDSNEDAISSRLVRKADFKVDHAETESAVNCCLVTRLGRLVTGGEDGICRVFDFDTSSLLHEWKVILSQEMKGHSNPVMALTEHLDYDWVCSASKDGTCKVWNVSIADEVDMDDGGDKDGDEDEDTTAQHSRYLLRDVPYVVELEKSLTSPKVGSMSAAVASSNKMQCRGCCFSLCGGYLFSIQSGKKGTTHLVKWTIEVEAEDQILSITPMKHAVASKSPCTTLKIDETGLYLAVGGSDGNITVFDAQSLKQLRSFVCHDFPVTGLTFAPVEYSRARGVKVVVTSSSPDRALVIIQMGGYSLFFQVTVVALLLLITVALYLYSFVLYELAVTGKLFPLQEL